MDFLKKHYEKLLLGIVLVGLAVAVAFLPFKIGAENQKLADLSNSYKHPPVKPLTNLDLSISERALKRMAAPVDLDLSTTNRLVNPMAWQQTRDNRLIRADRSGPTAVLVTNISPLYLTITLDSITASEDAAAAAPTRCMITVEKAAAPKPEQRRKKQTAAKIGEKNETFQLTEVKGPPDNPTNVVLVLGDSGEQIGINKEKPYRRVDGYMASLYYDPQKKKWTDQRIGQTININGEDYKIVAITKDEVVLSAPNQKHWPIKLSTPP